MTQLKNTQNNFIDNLYLDNKTVFAEIKPSKVSKTSRIGIYQNNLFENLRNALELTYRNVFKTLGTKKFKEITYQYIKKNRSQSGNLDNYGQNFPEFLQNDFLQDLAKIDLILQKIYLFADEKPLNIEKLQKIDPEKLFDLKFKLSKTAFLMQSKYSLFATKNRQIPRKNPCFFLIHREIFNCQAYKITKKEYQFLQSAQQNMTLYQIYQKYHCDIEKIMQKYIGNRVLIDFYF